MFPTSTSKMLSSVVLGSLALGSVSAILGGNIVELDVARFMTNFRHEKDGNALCGGVLIAPSCVLTTRSCMEQNPMYAAVGTRFSNGSTDIEAVKIKSNDTHPDYNQFDRSYDFAIVMLDGRTRPRLAQLPLPSEASRTISAGTITTTFGWGSTDPTKYDAIAEELHSVELLVWDTEACRKALGFDFIDDKFICAGGEEGKGPMLVDMGGPLGSKNKPSVFGNLAKALPWIYTHLSFLSAFQTNEETENHNKGLLNNINGQQDNLVIKMLRLAEI
ncbi:putative serine protease, trypsin domain, peptidase S1, PA clan [Plasmopara halstedii]